MATHTVIWKGTYEGAKQVAARLVRIMTGEDSSNRDIADGVNLAVGMAALSDIKADFVRKARGGTGEDGVKWDPLKPATIARRRLGPGEAAELKRLGIKRSERTNIEILRDTGILLNSLSPGQVGSVSGQVFDLMANGVIIGTNVPYAAVHQHGSVKKNIPARPFLPHRIPDKWQARWLRVANQALAIGARLLFERSSAA